MAEDCLFMHGADAHLAASNKQAAGDPIVELASPLPPGPWVPSC